jgi:hypothetical protein
MMGPKHGVQCPAIVGRVLSLWSSLWVSVAGDEWRAAMIR